MVLQALANAARERFAGLVMSSLKGFMGVISALWNLSNHHRDGELFFAL
jgi:hypothetical protein